MNERNLSRKLSTSVVETLKAHGHILVVKGGATALARELEELMAPSLTPISLRLEPRPIVGGEVTSTFGDEAIDEAVEDMVAEMTRALMDSDHVEDVFAEDNVIRRDIFRAVRDGLLQPAAVLGDDLDDEETSVKVRLDMLGYVAGTVSKRADAATLRNALERAAAMAQASFAAYSAEAREATFRLEGDGPDERLELEEAVADELTDLVEQGLVELPTVERTVDLGRQLSAAEQRGAGRRIEAIAETTLRSGGCAASWEFADPQTIHVTFTPLSDQDGREVDNLLASFVRELPALLAEVKPPPPPASARGRASAGPTSSRKGAPVSQREPAIVEAEEPSDDDEEEEEPLEVIEVAPASKRPRAAGKAAAGAAAAKPSSRKSAAGARATTRTAAPSRTSKRAAPKRAAGSEPKAAKPRAEAAKATRKPSATAKTPAARRAAAPAAKARKAPAKKR